jgi:hypothetical protein
MNTHMTRLFMVLMFVTALSVLHGQNPANSLAQLDESVKILGAEANKRLSGERAQQVTVGQWIYRDMVPPLGDYWQAQLMEELTNITDRSYQLVSGPQMGADWIVSGEIIEVVNIIRVYTRFVRTGGNTIVAIIHSDFERNEFFTDLLAGGGSSYIARDTYEPDSRENAPAVEIGAGDSTPFMSRTLHNSDDEDFFLLVPAVDGMMTAETNGSIDTVMELYEAGSQSSLAENDDGGNGNNARIRHAVRAGVRYIAKVRGYGSTTGSYGFRAYIVEQVHFSPDEYEDDNEFEAARDISIGTAQQHNFHSGSDVDWVKFRVTRAGRYVIRTRGVTSNQLDTYIELFDSAYNSIDENDDGGESLDSRLSVQLQPGIYYLMVECLNDEPDQAYTIRIDAE